MKGYYVITEDDAEQAERIKIEVLKGIAPGTRIEVYASEYEARRFVERLADQSKEAPLAWIGDGMMLWTKPMKNQPKPDKGVDRGGTRLAGERLRKLLRAHKHLRRIPWVVYSANGAEIVGYKENDNDPLNAFMRKEESIQKLLSLIESLREKAASMSDTDFDDGRWDESNETETSKISADQEFRQSIIDGLKMSWSECRTFDPLTA